MNLGDLVAHPLAEMFPMMEGEAFDTLVRDIKQNGCHYPIILHEGKILDGRNRYRALRQLGRIPIVTLPYDGKDPLGFVLSSNVHRRHLTAEQRREIIARVLKEQPERSDRAIGKLVQADGKTVAAVRADLEGRAEIPHATARTDTKGRQQPARKTSPAAPEAADTGAPSLLESVSLEEWRTLDDATKATLLPPDPALVSVPQFNKQESAAIEWAMWSWNPITGCEHNCPYCYAREIATSAKMSKSYPNGFAPTLRPRALLTPRKMRVPREAETDTRHRNVFTGSMADIFGRWVPSEWIEALLAEIRAAAEWNFLCLTKFPKRMAEFDIPPNAWMGTTVDLQARVPAAEAAFANVGAKVKWLSCEPLIEPLRFNHLDRFDWIVIGGASRTSTTPEWKPSLPWIIDLVQQARDAGVKVYFKTNLLGSRILELPFDAPIEADPVVAPAIFDYLKPERSAAA